ncbi:MAG: hypothetical protein EOP90_10900 [Lysobacteraceae bacterium]|nr:MAG: hypothetical protein EOP90_10900 [Xanthomonadaceae bacterium]
MNRIFHCLPGVLASLLCACATTSPQGPRPAADAPELVASKVDAGGRMRGIVINRRYGDFFMIDGKEVHREIELAWDYERGTAIRRTYDLSGALLTTEDLPGAEMRLTPLEDERVKDLVRGYPTLEGVASEPGVVIWAGGFVMRIPGDRYCDKGTRCIYATLSTDGGFTPIVRAIVDLQRDRVVYPDFDPGTRSKTATPSMGSK